MMNPTTISPESASANPLGLSAKGKKGKSGLQQGLFSRLLVKLQQTAQQEGSTKAGNQKVSSKDAKFSLGKLVQTPLMQGQNKLDQTKSGKGIRLILPNQQGVLSNNIAQGIESKTTDKAGKVLTLKTLAANKPTSTALLSQTKLGKAEGKTSSLAALNIAAAKVVEVGKKSDVLIAAVQAEQSKGAPSLSETNQPDETAKAVIATAQEAALLRQIPLLQGQNNGQISDSLDGEQASQGKKSKPSLNTNTQPLLNTKNDETEVSSNKTASFANVLDNSKATTATVMQNSNAAANQASIKTANTPQRTASASTQTVVQPNNSPLSGEVGAKGMNPQLQADAAAKNASLQQQAEAALKNTAQADSSTVGSRGIKANDGEPDTPVIRSEKTVVSDGGQQDSVKSQQSPIAVLQQRAPNQATGQQSNFSIAQEASTLSNKIAESSGASGSQDFTSNQDGSEQLLLDANKAETRPTKGLDFQAQLAYKSQRTFTPNDAMLEIVRSAKDGSTSLELQLEPANLGKVVVNIQLDASKQLQVSFTVEHNASRHALEQQMPQLRLALAQQGLDLGNFNMQMNQQQQGNQQQGSGFAGNGKNNLDNNMQVSANIEESDTRIGVNLATHGRLSILA